MTPSPTVTPVFSKLWITRYDGKDLVDSCHVVIDSGNAKGVFEHIKRLPCAGTELTEGCTVIDLIEGDDINEDPITVPPDSRDWLLHDFLKLSRAGLKKAIRESNEATR